MAVPLDLGDLGFVWPSIRRGVANKYSFGWDLGRVSVVFCETIVVFFTGPTAIAVAAAEFICTIASYFLTHSSQNFANFVSRSVCSFSIDPFFLELLLALDSFFLELLTGSFSSSIRSFSRCFFCSKSSFSRSIHYRTSAFFLRSGLRTLSCLADRRGRGC